MPIPLTPPVSRRDLERFLFHDLTRAVPLRGQAGLAHARRLARLLDDPQDRARHVHVVGTAGKGTTATALTHLVVGVDMSVATHLSPHVYDVRERFLIDGSVPPWREVLAAAVELHEAAEKLTAETGQPPSFFAAVAALTWILGRRVGVDLLITEAGIGGRHDASNVIGRSDKITVVTNVGLDHAEVLGDDVSAIAREKADVIGAGGIVIVGPQSHPEVVDVVADIASDRDARLVVVDQSITDWRRAAAAVAEAAAAELDIAPPSSRTASRQLPRPPGRGESWDMDGRRVVFDGAHNPMKLEALLGGLEAEDARPALAVVAVGAGKDLEDCADVIAARVGAVIVTEFGDRDDPVTYPRSWPAVTVATALRERGVKIVAEDPDRAAAADHALDVTTAGQLLVVTGSFFHLAGVRDRMVERSARADPVAETGHRR